MLFFDAEICEGGDVRIILVKYQHDIMGAFLIVGGKLFVVLSC